MPDRDCSRRPTTPAAAAAAVAPAAAACAAAEDDAHPSTLSIARVLRPEGRGTRKVVSCLRSFLFFRGKSRFFKVSQREEVERVVEDEKFEVERERRKKK